MFAFEAAGESTGITITRPVTCSGCSSWSSRIAATWPSYSSPWLPARTSTVGPSPFAIEAMWTNVLAQPAVFVILGNARCPICLPRRGRSIEQETAGLPALIRHARLQVARDGALRRLEQPVDVVVCVRVREVTSLQVQRQLEDAVLHQLAAVADEEVDVVPEQVVVADDRALRGSS